MKLSNNQKKGASLALAGLLGLFTGTYLPPELFAQIMGAFA